MGSSSPLTEIGPKGRTYAGLPPPLEMPCQPLGQSAAQMPTPVGVSSIALISHPVGADLNCMPLGHSNNTA